MPAEYYLDTIRVVFQDHLLPRGLWDVRGQCVRGVQNVLTSAVIERDNHRDAGIVGGQGFGVVDQVNDVLIERAAITDDAQTDSVFMKFGGFRAQVGAQQAHQFFDFVFRT